MIANTPYLFFINMFNANLAWLTHEFINVFERVYHRQFAALELTIDKK